MKNLSEFKKALQLGSQWETVYHLGNFKGRGEDGKPIYEPRVIPARPVSIVKSNSVAFKTVKSDGTLCDSWLQFPKASECKFQPDRVEVYIDGVLTLTYRLVSESQN